MKKHLKIAVIAVSCLGFICSFSALNIGVQKASAAEKITVLTPLGHPPNITLKKMAPRLDTLEGKTIYVVDNIYPGSDRLLTEIAAWFEREMPKTKAIYKRKQAAMGGFEGEDTALWAEIKEKGDAVVIGLGH